MPHLHGDLVLVQSQTAHRAARLQNPLIQSSVVLIQRIPGLRQWTDDFNNLIGVLK